jgi:hypothetical protein
VVDVVVAVSTAVSGVAPLMETEVGERLHVGVLTGFETLVVTAQVSVTVPLNEFAGVTVMVEVLPLVAPPVTVMLAELERAKSVLPVGAAQKFLHPERKPIARQLIPRTQTVEKPVRSGAAIVRSRASSLKFIAAPLMTPFCPASRVALPSGSCLFPVSGGHTLAEAQIKRRAATEFAHTCTA